MKRLHAYKLPEVTYELYSLACGSDPQVIRCSGCIVKGIRFHNSLREKIRKAQNSGVVVKGEHEDHDMDFFGILTYIIVLNYYWWDVSNRKGIRIDEHFMSVNLFHIWYKDDPFVLAPQVEQAFYLKDTKLKGVWHVVQNEPLRNLYDIL